MLSCWDAQSRRASYWSDSRLAQHCPSSATSRIRSHILRCLRDFPQSGEGVITLGGVEHCFIYTVQGDVVDTVIGSPDYIEQVLKERGLSSHEASSPLSDPEHKH